MALFRVLCRIAAAAAVGKSDVLEEGYREAQAGGADPGDLSEATLQVFLFAGYPRAIQAFETLHRILPELPEPPQEPRPADLEERGFALFRRIYDFQAGRVLERLRSLHPELARFILRDAYGLVLSRPFLDVVVRELLAVSMLTALALPNQLRAHVRGCRHAGASREDIRVAFASACDLAPEGEQEALEQIVREELK